jgi:hypothetical protein
VPEQAELRTTSVLGRRFDGILPDAMPVWEARALLRARLRESAAEGLRPAAVASPRQRKNLDRLLTAARKRAILFCLVRILSTSAARARQLHRWSLQTVSAVDGAHRDAPPVMAARRRFGSWVRRTGWPATKVAPAI